MKVVTFFQSKNELFLNFRRITLFIVCGCLQGGRNYNIVQFINKNNKADIGIISDNWMGISCLQVYCPPATVPTLVLAKAHSSPSPEWVNYDVINDLFTTSKFNKRGVECFIKPF